MQTRWLTERVYHAREAELQSRVDRARVRIVSANAIERSLTFEAFGRFAAEIVALGAPRIGGTGDEELECEPVAAKGGHP